MKVYRWQDDRTQTARLCAAESRAELLRITGYPSRRWLFNLSEVRRTGMTCRFYDMALAEPGVIFARPTTSFRGEWERV